MKRYILAHDLGTSGNKASIYSIDGKLITSATYCYETKYADGGIAEQNPDDWWTAIVNTTNKMIQKIHPEEIACICFSAQMMGLVCIDKNGNVLRNSLIHCDQRAIKQNLRLLEKIDELKFYKITGHKASPNYPLQKLMWIKDNEPECYKNTYKVLNAKDYIVFKMTGEIMTDYTDASGTNAFDLKTNQWSEELCNLADVDINKFPEVKSSTHVVGEISLSASKELGLAKGTLVVLGAGDGMCSSVGCGAVKPGKVYNYIGSSSWITSILKQPVFDEKMRLETFAHPAGKFFNVGGTMQTAGACFEWAAKNLYGSLSSESIMKELSETKPGSSGVIFLPYLNGERVPFWNENARGTFIGISNTTTRADMLRAVMEGVALNLKIILDIYRKYINVDEIIVIGGAARNSIWTQIIADVYGAKILKPENLSEITSLGAAIIGGVGTGLFKDFTVAEDFLSITETQSPREEYRGLYDKLLDVFQKSYYSLIESYGLLQDLKRECG